MKNFKKIVCLLMVVFMLLTAAACNGNNNNNQNENANNTQDQNNNDQGNEENQNQNQQNDTNDVNNSQNTNDENTNESGNENNNGNENNGNEVSKEVVMPDFEIENPEVNFLFTHGPGENHEFMLEKFTEYTGEEIEIIFDVVTWNEYQTKLSIMVMGGQAPDMYQIDRVVTPYIIREDLFEPMDELIDYDDPMWEGLKPYTDYSTYKGTIYSIPNERPRAIQTVIFNTKFFEDFGLETPRELFYKDEWTWDVFLEYAQMFTEDSDGDGETDVYGVSMGDFACMYFAAATGNDIVKFNNDGTIENNLRDPNFERSFELYNELGKAGALDPVQWEAVKNFPQNKIAMRIDHFWVTVNDPYNSMLKNGELSFAPLPRDPQSDTYYHVGTVADQFVPKGATNPEGAIAWYTFNRYLQLKPDEEIEQKNYELWSTTWGWSDEDIEMAEEIMRYDLEPIIIAGDRMPGFAKQLDLWNMPATEPWSKVVEEINPNLQEAIDQLNAEMDE